MEKRTHPARARQVGSKEADTQPAAESHSSGPGASTGDVADKQGAAVSWPTEAKFKATRKKELISLRLDVTVIEWFKGQGPGYQTRMNALLRAYAERARADAGKEQP